MFRDRQEAGALLAKAMEPYRGPDTVVLALPRGGVVLGYEVAQALGAPLDIVVPRKIGHPSSPEYAIGAVDETGTRILNEAEAKMVDATWLKEETKRQEEEAQRRVTTYRGKRNAFSLRGKTVILVDDGIATGLTMQLALRRAAAEGAARSVVAVPVASADALDMLAKEGAEIVCLEPPENFLSAVGAHYQHFEQVSDAEVVQLLANDTTHV
jgi:predicted phosphoribosyltransferase